MNELTVAKRFVTSVQVDIEKLIGQRNKHEALIKRVRHENRRLRARLPMSTNRIIEDAFVDAELLIDKYLLGEIITKRNGPLGHTKWLNARALLRMAVLWLDNRGLRPGLTRRQYITRLEQAKQTALETPEIFYNQLPDSIKKLKLK